MGRACAGTRTEPVLFELDQLSRRHQCRAQRFDVGARDARLTASRPLFGPVVSWNVLVRLDLVHFGLRDVPRASGAGRGGGRPRSWEGCSTASASTRPLQASGYVFLTFVPLPPIIYLLLYEGLVRQRWRPARTGVLLAVVCTAQFLVSSEIFASTVLFGFIAVVLYLLAERQLLRRAMAVHQDIRHVGHRRRCDSAGAAGRPGHSSAPRRRHGTPNAAVKLFHGDLLGGIVPTRFPTVHDPRANSSFSYAASWRSSADLYVGLPFVLAIAGTWSGYASAASWCWQVP